jgi:arabinose-5-phosphate isomerase
VSSVKYFDAANEVFDKAIEGIDALKGILNDDFDRAVDIISEVKGHVILSGMGKSGHVARKIAATMASTGTPAHFVHPGEASHGDLGMVTKDDCVILLSNSGETSELGDFIHYCKRFSIPLIAIVRRSGSLLVESADVAFVLPATPEASPVNAPTTSTTMMLVWGDALAMASLNKRGFKPEDFKVFHPGGKLGSQLLRVDQLMKTGDDLPVVSVSAVMSDALFEISAKSLGCAVVVDGNKPVGVITDGDLRRHMTDNFATLAVDKVMTESPILIQPEMLAAEALAIMNDKSITSLIVAKNTDELAGVLHIHDILRAGVS